MSIFSKIKAIVNKITCRHGDLNFIRKTHGDENNVSLRIGGRYVHKCNDCGKLIYRNEEAA